MLRSRLTCSTSSYEEDDQGKPAVRRGGGLSRPLRRVGGLSRRLHVQRGRCHPPHLPRLPPSGARRRRLERQDQAPLEPPPEHGRIQFHRLNINNSSRLEGPIKMSDLTINLAAVCTPAEYNTHLLDTIYSNFFNAPPVVKYCSENNKRLIHFSTCEVLGRLLEAFSQRISLRER
uniref:NAD-dependent epimerase/dehydratase domain-containing protein n=1 Tax=Ananas comosus var. bracteatus TaxID=296719 RepID=A0A6V7PKV0_ANACO|nr:unnamed protein product [Ananas comosus var. bracteatus]